MQGFVTCLLCGGVRSLHEKISLFREAANERVPVSRFVTVWSVFFIFGEAKTLQLSVSGLSELILIRKNESGWGPSSSSVTISWTVNYIIIIIRMKPFYHFVFLILSLRTVNMLSLCTAFWLTIVHSTFIRWCSVVPLGVSLCAVWFCLVSKRDETLKFGLTWGFDRNVCLRN